VLQIRVAELNIEIDNAYPYLARQCRDYLATFERADITVRVTPEEIEEEGRVNPYSLSPDYLESVCAYRQIAFQLPLFGAIVFHASVVECDGRAYAFAAHSGTGKSTHTRLWLRVFGDRARVINGDKPIFRLTEQGWRAYGTPWCGKEKWGENASSPLAALCFLERSPRNRIAPIGNDEAVNRLFGQVLMPSEPETADRFFALLDDLIQNTPAYLLGCNMEPEAAEVALAGMQKGETI